MDPDFDADPDSGHFFKICGIFMNKAEFSNFLSYFFFLKLEPFRDQEIFIISLFLIVQMLV